jgi:hypothetical protein
MTFDERINLLTERHEALAQSLELLTKDVHQLQIVSKQQSDNISALMRIMEGQDQRIGKLVTIAESHERRLTRLEGGEER